MYVEGSPANGCKGKGKAPPPLPSGKGKGKQSRARPLKIVVQKGFTGETFTVESSSGDRIADVKDKINRQLGVPPLCQKLIANDAGGVSGPALDDAVRVRTCCSENADTVRLVMVVSDASARVDALSDDIERRVMAVQAFGHLALLGNSDGFDSLVACLDDQEPIVRREASRCLARLATKLQDEGAIQALGRCMGWEFADDLNETTPAHEALAYLLKEGSELSWTVVTRLMQRLDTEACREAVKVIAIAAFFHKCSRAVEALSGCFEHDDARMRRAAACSTAFVATPGDARAVAALAECLQDTAEEVKVAAVAGLGQVTANGDPRIVGMLLAILAEQSDVLKGVSLVALGKVASPGDPKVIAVVRALVDDPSGPPHALSTLAKLVESGDEKAFAAVKSRLADPDWNVRGTAIAVLVRLAHHDDDRLTVALASALRDSNVHVSITSIYALAYIARYGHEEAISILRECCGHHRPMVKEAAEVLLGYIRDEACGDMGSARALRQAVSKKLRWWSVELDWPSLRSK